MSCSPVVGQSCPVVHQPAQSKQLTPLPGNRTRASTTPVLYWKPRFAPPYGFVVINAPRVAEASLSVAAPFATDTRLLYVVTLPFSPHELDVEGKESGNQHGAHFDLSSLLP